MRMMCKRRVDMYLYQPFQLARQFNHHVLGDYLVSKGAKTTVPLLPEPRPGTPGRIPKVWRTFPCSLCVRLRGMRRSCLSCCCCCCRWSNICTSIHCHAITTPASDRHNMSCTAPDPRQKGPSILRPSYLV